ncbi:CD3072 family TudS-related putative desulfidase [Marinisporobacter balticus]|uniref:Putative secreted protein n=1 Tax=Marinisporobacter balticus TaxID=2018667 RepID=A0A4R2KFP7_9FIRM|nr:CD3072 family TudS-related putative desulfidase [Marinisporobacter balticus]TCO69226.1 putative secreted protein [Marinisporobacter balticus]
MFSDARSKKIILVSHCILNQNSISDGTADYPGTNESILKLLIQSNVGIIQMPCPEILSLGLDRGDIHGAEREIVTENTRIRHALEDPNSIEIINNLVKQIIFQIEEYIRNGFTILGIIGINRSPSCGVNTTSKNNQEVDGGGIFIEIFKKELEKKRIIIDMIGIKATETDKALKSIQRLIDKY